MDEIPEAPEEGEYGTERVKFWTEEKRRCRLGWIAPDGKFINPIYYFFLNHVKIDYEDPIRGMVEDFPPYTVKEHELFDKVYYGQYDAGNGFVHEAEDLIAMKARRKRWTYNTHCGIFMWDFCLGDIKIKVAIGYDVTGTLEDGQKLFRDTYERLHPFWKADALYPDKAGRFGFAIDEGDGDTKKYRVLREIIFRSLDKTPAGFKGLRLKRGMFEEAGKYTNLQKALSASQRCFYMGSVKTGQLLIGGTADSITNKSTGYIDMCKNAKGLNLIKHFISAAELAYPDIDEFTGESLTDKATPKYLKVRQNYLDNGMIEAYYGEIQENPLYEEEAYMSPSLSTFPASKLQDQHEYIYNNGKDKQIKLYRLEWEFDRLTKKKSGRVKAILDPLGHWRIYNNGMPQRQIKFLDLMTVDDVYKDKAVWSDSKCGIMLYRQPTHKMESDLPIATYLFRPQNKVLFYEEVVKAIAFWGARVLAENNDEACLNYIEKKQYHEHIMYVNGNRGIRNSDKSLSDQETMALMYFAEDRHKQIYFPEILDALKVQRSDNSDIRSVFFLMMLALDILKDEANQGLEEKPPPPIIVIGKPVNERNGNMFMPQIRTQFSLGRKTLMLNRPRMNRFQE
jgi:hypothetical protein